MGSRTAFALTLAALALSACQSSGGGEQAATPPGAAPPLVAADKTGRCVAEAARLFSAPADDVATSAEYPLAAGGSAIDGSVNQGGIKQFRCEYDRAGVFVQVAPLAEGAA